MNQAQCGYDHAPAGPDLLVRYGPSLKVNLGFDPNYVAGFRKPPQPTERGLDALIDTGASESYIDGALAVQHQLPLIDQDSVGAALGTEIVNIYLAQVHVIALDAVILGRFAAVSLRSNGIESDVLLGRTFLRDYVFTYDGTTGRVTIARPAL